MKILYTILLSTAFITSCAAKLDTSKKEYSVDYKFTSNGTNQRTSYAEDNYEEFQGFSNDNSAKQQNNKERDVYSYGVYYEKVNNNIEPIKQNVSGEGKDYSADGFFNEAPKELNNTSVKTTGKCKAKFAPGPRKIGKPYKINGVTYYPMESADGYNETGIASWYGPGFHGKLTANGEKYNQRAMTAAHKTLPLPTLVKVQNLENGKSIVVRVNDRGPYSKGRIIDLTEVGAERLGMIDKGTAKVHISVLSEDPDCYVTQGREIDITKGSFAIQIGAFTLKDNAERLKESIGNNVEIISGEVNGRILHKVLITGFNTEQDAKNSLDNEISKKYPKAFIVRK